MALPRRSTLPPLVAAVLLTALIACGGGGGSSSLPNPVSVPQEPIDTQMPDQAPGQTPGVLSAGLVAPDLLEVVIQDGRVLQGAQAPYQALAGDSIQVEGTAPYTTHWLVRSGKHAGILVGPGRQVLWSLDRFQDALASTTFLDSVKTYAISSNHDNGYTTARRPLAVYRKTRPQGCARLDAWSFRSPLLHSVYLKLPAPLKEGLSYRVTFGRQGLDGYPFTFDSRTLITSALHVNGLGFHPEDGRKIAFLSLWLGTGGGLAYALPLGFELVDEASGEAVFQGQVRLLKGRDQGEDGYQRSYSKTDVYQLDFSGFRTEGRYHLRLPGIGRSRSFEIRSDVWTKAFRSSIHGLLNQRSGIALGPPSTAFVAERGFHPEDGMDVRASTCPLMDSGNGLNARGDQTDNFKALVEGATSTPVPEAWGGYHDAGDWDRRIQHLDASRALIELTELFPDVFSASDLGLPESGNGLPDVLNEVLWNMELYRRMQTPEGGIRGGVESAEHPLAGETSWQESLPVFAYAPDMWCSYLYAADAARLSSLLRPYRPSLADLYQTSAMNAAEFAEQAFAHHDYEVLPWEVRNARNLAAASLYRLTGLDRWHQIFKDTCAITAGDTPLSQWSDRNTNDGWDQHQSVFLYLSTASHPLDAVLQLRLSQAYKAEADRQLAIQAQMGFRWVKTSAWTPYAWGAAGSAKVETLLRAHRLFQDPAYLSGAQEATQFTLGANPTNWCFTTGLGVNPVQHAFVIDSRLTGQPVPEGITVYGPGDPVLLAGDGMVQTLITPYTVPAFEHWPANEAYFDVYFVFSMNEFTIMETIAHNLYAWGYFKGLRH